MGKWFLSMLLAAGLGVSVAGCEKPVPPVKPVPEATTDVGTTKPEVEKPPVVETTKPAVTTTKPAEGTIK